MQFKPSTTSAVDTVPLPGAGESNAVVEIEWPSSCVASSRMTAFVAVALTLVAAEARGPEPLEQEWMGMEASPAAVASGRILDAREEHRGFQVKAGLGPWLKMRGGRHRWQRYYWTPLQAGLVLAVAGGPATVGASAGTEAGIILRSTTASALEFGLALEGGFLSTEMPGNCDGACFMIGLGALPSLVARWIIDDRPPVSVAAFLRVTVPLSLVSTRPNGIDHQFYSVLVAGLDFGLGRR